MIPRTFPPAPGWSPGGRRIKSELDYGRGPEKTWVYGGLRVRDGQQVSMTATSRNSVFYQQFLQKLEAANPAGDIYVITDNLSSHSSLSTPGLAHGPPQDQAHLHTPWRVLAQPPGSVVEDLPQSRPRRPDLRRTRRNHPGHCTRHHPAQPPGTAMDLGQTGPAHPTPTTPLCLPPLRNAALLGV
ncbi:hypothetical protein ABZ829_11710 [Streptomyces xanthochromogenes]|uniref:hypothetical protein n=1 Tax=Streptomyces xanthochromogenes TaxID=67384 RepID=UPI0034421911